MDATLLRGNRLTKYLVSAYFAFVVLWLAFQIIFTYEVSTNLLTAAMLAWIGFMVWRGENWAKWALVAGLTIWGGFTVWMLAKIMAWYPWTNAILLWYVAAAALYCGLIVTGLMLPSVNGFLTHKRNKGEADE